MLARTDFRHIADPNALVQGQVIVAVGGPIDGGAVSPGYVSAVHRVTDSKDPINTGLLITYSDTILTSVAIDGGTYGNVVIDLVCAGALVAFGRQPAPGRAA